MVEVIWHGHACFELRGENTTVVFDPFSGLGIPEPKAKADLVLCSHSHGDHNNADSVVIEDGSVLEGFIGATEAKGIPVQGIATFHDSTGGSRRGNNSIHVIQLEGLTFCHIGDLGHDLTDEHMQKIGSIDVLFIPVGGGPTIDPDLAASISERLNPIIILPMHYNADIPGQREWIGRNLYRVEGFLTAIDPEEQNVERVDAKSYHITNDTLPMEHKIIVLSLK